jgi:DNA-binding GntR family transcriptional regulator
MRPTAVTNLELLRSQTLSGLVQEEIIRRIKVGELDAGAKLNELDLSEHLRISRSPVREAFSALEEAGLVRLEKNRGAYIREISDAEAGELYHVRATLDEATGRALTMSITENQVRELRDAIAALEASATRSVNEYFPLNIAFHDRVVEMTGNATMLKLYRQVINRMHLLRRRGFSLSGSSAKSHKEHRRIVAALAARDPDLAGAAMREHVMAGFKRTVGASLKMEADKRAATG